MKKKTAKPAVKEPPHNAINNIPSTSLQRSSSSSSSKKEDEEKKKEERRIRRLQEAEELHRKAEEMRRKADEDETSSDEEPPTKRRKDVAEEEDDDDDDFFLSSAQKKKIAEEQNFIRRIMAGEVLHLREVRNFFHHVSFFHALIELTSYEEKHLNQRLSLCSFHLPTGHHREVQGAHEANRVEDKEASSDPRPAQG